MLQFPFPLSLPLSLSLICWGNEAQSPAEELRAAKGTLQCKCQVITRKLGEWKHTDENRAGEERERKRDRGREGDEPNAGFTCLLMQDDWGVLKECGDVGGGRGRWKEGTKR